jgi:hypothetical protein
MATGLVKGPLPQVELRELAASLDQSLCARSHFNYFLPGQTSDPILATVQGAARHFLQDAKSLIRLNFSGPDIKCLTDEDQRLPESTLQTCLFGGANEDGPSSLKLAGRKMVTRNITWRLTQRFARSCKVGVPFAFSRPGDRDRDLLNACGFRKPRPVGPRFSQPAFVEETI